MKKLLPILILLAFVAFCYQLIVSFFITEHEVEYSIVSSDQKHYTISEKYKKDDDNHYYSFLIDLGKRNFSTAVMNDFDKQDRVITDIKYYEKGNLECIFPIYKRGYNADLLCLLDNEQVSPFYLQQTDNEDFSYIISKALDDGYEEVFYEEPKNGEKYQNKEVFLDYIPEDFYFAVWNYRGIDIINQDTLEEKQFLNNDQYENTLSAVVGKYYVTVNTDNQEEELNYYQIIVYNLVDGGKSIIDVNISQDVYFNGVYNDKLYITDPKEKVQYLLDPKEKEITELSDYKVIENGKLKSIGEELFHGVYVDSNRVVNKTITKLYGTEDIQKDGNNYYFLTEDGKLYRVIEEDYKHPILLCQFDSIVEWKAHDNALSFISSNTLYLYTDYYGLKPILVHNELNYNYQNIYDFVRGE